MDAIFVNYSDEEIWKANKKPPLHLNKKKRERKESVKSLYQFCFVITALLILVANQLHVVDNKLIISEYEGIYYCITPLAQSYRNNNPN